MKKILVMAVLAALVATSASAMTTIANSAHDLSTINGGTNTEICVYCHTPHAASTTVTLAPLWNRDTTSVASGEIYTSTTINYAATFGSINATDAPLCLSCHDGVVGNSLVNAPNNGLTFNIGGAAVDGNAIVYDTTNKLKNDHPIGMNIPTSGGADTGIFDASVINGKSGMAGALRGADNTVWCSSCHDVHDNTVKPFLLVNNQKSVLCLNCHNK